jgi:hypothetical protein
MIWWKAKDCFFKMFLLQYLKELKFVVVASNYVILCFAIPTFYCMIFYVLGFKVNFFLLQNKNLFVSIIFDLSPKLKIDQVF